MINYKLRKSTVKAVIILIAIFFILFGSVTAWGISQSNKKLSAITQSQLVKNPIKLGPHESPLGSKYKIMLDPGHGGHDPGATGASGKYERDYTLSLAMQVFDLLSKDAMFDVQMTRASDEFIELDDRAAMANQWDADALLSIHANTFTDASASGTETLYTNEDSIQLAQIVQHHVVQAMGFRDRGAKEEQLKVLSLSEMPAVLVEVGYLTNADEEAVMLASDGKSLAAHGIVEGLRQYFKEYGKKGLPVQGQPSEGGEELANGETAVHDLPDWTGKIYYNGSKEQGKRTALTFDDGPDGAITPQILDILKQNDIKATFFMLGKQAQAHPDMVKRMLKEGHVIANHSWSHPHFNKLTIEEAKRQIMDTQDQLEAIAGKRPLLFRPPYGEVDEVKEKAIAQMGLAIVNWSVDTMDWSGLTAKEIMKIVNKQIYPGGIILQHSSGGKDNTVEALKKIIPNLKKDGYSFVTVPELLGLPDYQDA